MPLDERDYITHDAREMTRLQPVVVLVMLVWERREGGDYYVRGFKWGREACVERGGGTSEGVTQVFEIFIFQFKLQKLARYGF